ncbi:MULTISPECIES: glycosyltransferase family 4 protein [Bacillus cereus group]|uniref:glycosyltransferase family 4 protein n=1 Tax=Bacillus cereus group TaxID=86661 RepID=UPI0011ECB2BB|nr:MULTISPECIES: glycosyltransferase family 4 protein [Bacillus cereus group]KAA0780303.1 transporter [Bacillus sp. TE8-1]MCS6592448.1 transporter [Bacillus cereus]MEC2710806.1 transporter [Bacillus cereus]MEC2742249.1 transporter [Bacillus cereus]MEC2753412.1 transporter [Bacillus cereus]
MKRVVVISYWYYPENVARAFHVKGIVSSLIKDGYHVDLVLPKNAMYQEIGNKNSNNITLHQVKPGILLHKEKNRWDVNRNILNNSHSNLLTKGLKKLYDVLIWPDRTIEWAINAYRYVKKNKLHSNSMAMVTVGLPVSTHITGHLLKKDVPHLKWIADYGDPFSYNPDREIRKYDRFLESRMLNNVDSIVIPTESAIDCYTNLGVNKSQIHVIPQLFEEEQGESNYEVDKDKFNIMYAGSFYRGIRSPVEFIHALSLASKRNKQIEFHYFGNVTALEEFLNMEGLDKEKLPIKINDFKSRSEILNIMREMDLLINLNNKSTSQIPSKIIDYLYANKRILNIGNNLNELFDNVDNEKEKIADRLVEISLNPLEFNYDQLKKFYSYNLNSTKYLNLLK